jgi:hypothetical protein
MTFRITPPRALHRCKMLRNGLSWLIRHGAPHLERCAIIPLFMRFAAALFQMRLPYPFH